MVKREQIQKYLQDMATRISKTKGVAPFSLQVDKLFACMDMAKTLLDADEVTVDGNWKVTIKGGNI